MFTFRSLYPLRPFARAVSLVLGTVGTFVTFLQAAHAQTSTPPGTNNQPLPTIGSAFGGTQVGTTQTATFTGSNAGQTITGRLISAIFRGGTTQLIDGVTYGGGDQLDFYYQIFLDSGNTTTVDSVSLSSFANATLATAQVTADADGPATNPLTAGGSPFNTVSRGGGAGTGLLFSFSSPLTISGFSQTAVVRSTSTTFVTTGGASVQSLSGVSANAVGTVLAVSSIAAPEPGSLALLSMAGLGMLGGSGLIRRRKSAAL